MLMSSYGELATVTLRLNVADRPIRTEGATPNCTVGIFGTKNESQ